MGIGAAGNVVNDLFDLPADRVNRPERPLAKGTIGVPAALALALVAAIAGLVTARAAGRGVFVLGGAALVAMVVYSPFLKAHGVPGNLTVAAVAALPLLYGALAAGDAGAGVLPFVLGAWLHLARELAKDADDAAGDTVLGRRTVATRWSPAVARSWSAGAAISFIPVSALPVFVAGYHPRYLGFAAVAAGAALWATRRLRSGASGGPAALKLAMTIGLVGLVAGRL
jgi:4-hydroxybenzoate polyprenyltransferase